MFLKTYDELTFTDDFMFCRIMQDEKICKKVIKTMLGIEVDRIEYLNVQHDLSIDYFAHGVRMDVYVKDSTRIFNLEMQNRSDNYLGLRARYYHALADLDSMSRIQSDSKFKANKNNYSKLKETFIVFLCKSDPSFGNLPKYEMERVCLQGNQYTESLTDKVHCIYYNASSWKDCQDKDVQAFLKYLATTTAESELTKEIDFEVQHHKGNDTWRKDFMFLSDWLYRELEEGFAEGVAKGVAEGMEKGIAEGMEKGIAEGMEKGVAEGMAKGVAEGIEKGKIEGIADGEQNEKFSTVNRMHSANMTIDQICIATDLPEEKVLEILKK